MCGLARLGLDSSRSFHHWICSSLLNASHSSRGMSLGRQISRSLVITALLEQFSRAAKAFLIRFCVIPGVFVPISHVDLVPFGGADPQVDAFLAVVDVNAHGTFIHAFHVQDALALVFEEEFIED